MQQITLTIDSSLENVALVDTAVQGICTLTPFNPAAVSDIQLCVAEEVNNVIEHAYAGQAGHQITVCVSLQANGMIIEVADTGLVMNVRLQKLINGTENIAPPNPEFLPEGGWGLYIIKTKMDKVTYRTLGQVHILQMTKLFDSKK